MKYYLLLTALLTLGFAGCDQEHPHPFDRVVDTGEYVSSDDPLYNIVFSDEYNFDNLHQYYLEVKKNRSGDANFENLRSLIISHMELCENRLQDQNDPGIIEYYVKEILSMRYINDMQLLAVLLTKLKGYWDIEKIRSTAEFAYNRNIRYIYDNFPEPDKVLQIQGRGVFRLQSISKLKE